MKCRLQQPDWAHSWILVTGKWLTAGQAQSAARVFCAQRTVSV